ncbi:MAG TPA: hypothetical protein VFV38_43560, partial [Ktedonobacteraceae bacterium]|nr:hypothetical protein [Ktedonobacteraceae bacterium]
MDDCKGMLSLLIRGRRSEAVYLSLVGMQDAETRNHMVDECCQTEVHYAQRLRPFLGPCCAEGSHPALCFHHVSGAATRSARGVLLYSREKSFFVHV